jgi:hypothetical protein
MQSLIEVLFAPKNSLSTYLVHLNQGDLFAGVSVHVGGGGLWPSSTGRMITIVCFGGTLRFMSHKPTNAIIVVCLVLVPRHFLLFLTLSL